MMIVTAVIIMLWACLGSQGELTTGERQDMTLNLLTRQLMTMQMHLEEKTRTDGVSGIKQIRSFREGTRPYFSPHYIGGNIAAIHEHGNNVRTVGLGEMVVVINGIEFRTRHNDYRLYQAKHMDSMTRYEQTEDIPFPDVPPTVTGDVSEQIKEMQEYFRAFKNNDPSHRDFKPYFQPIICYMEAAWTQPSDTIQEAFESDRHVFDASSWFEMQEKVRFTSYSGRKNQLENFAFLPTTIVDVSNLTDVQYAQLNYRIICHKIQRSFSFTQLRVLNDFASRMPARRNWTTHVGSRAAHYQVHPYDENEERSEEFNLLDELMSEIPSKDGYGIFIEDDTFGSRVKNVNDSQTLNAAYYHRFYKMSGSQYMRGFSDRTLYVALTNRPEVVPFSFEEEGKEPVKRRVTYAIPMEIIFLTPLSTWNPYHLHQHSDGNSAEKTVQPDGSKKRDRNGELTPEKAYNGTDQRHYYLTPIEFYQSGECQDCDPADTAKAFVGAIDPDRIVHKVASAGTRIIMPAIGGGVGTIRQRYPIMPAHPEGGAAWKEMDALREAVLKARTYQDMYRQKPPIGPEIQITGIEDQGITLITGLSTINTNESPHVHEVELTQLQVDSLKAGQKLTDIYTSQNNGHAHQMDIIWDEPTKTYQYTKCGGQDLCVDGHPTELFQQ